MHPLKRFFRAATAIVLGVCYFLLFSPAALVLRLVHGDPMRRDLDTHAHTYRIASRSASKESLHRPG